MKIDIQRLTALMNGEVEPQSDAEEWFVEALGFGLEGFLLKDILMEGGILDNLGHDELLMYIVGYAMGQSLYEQENFINSDGGKTLH